MKMKKLLSVILSLSLAICLLSVPITARAAEEESGEFLPEELREILQRLGEQLQSGGEDLQERVGAALESVDIPALTTRLREVFQDTSSMTDEELSEEIRALAEEGGLTLSDAQADWLVKLCRRLEGLDEEALKEKLEELKNSAQKLSEAREKAEELRDKAQQAEEQAGGFFRSVKDFFHRVGDFVSGLIGGGA